MGKEVRMVAATPISDSYARIHQQRRRDHEFVGGLRYPPLGKKGEVFIQAKWPIAAAYPCFLRMRRLGVFLLPQQWDGSPSKGYPSYKLVGTHLYTRV